MISRGSDETKFLRMKMQNGMPKQVCAIQMGTTELLRLRSGKMVKRADVGAAVEQPAQRHQRHLQRHDEHGDRRRRTASRDP